MFDVECWMFPDLTSGLEVFKVGWANPLPMRKFGSQIVMFFNVDLYVFAVDSFVVF